MGAQRVFQFSNFDCSRLHLCTVVNLLAAVGNITMADAGWIAFWILSGLCVLAEIQPVFFVQFYQLPDCHAHPQQRHAPELLVRPVVQFPVHR
ncbi:hypothetical protein B0T14DRAFT_333050 [Immersiella caudata]|uniref:Uncharacterized protein n=1 Tax=Immersiella caudata TaxID=314043 RepID=A0AA39TSY6_9PEZI|nr:hypothetical protein B0T14DRAFT_333050 [Immersiella caudata]